jgi:hypothetical protein
LTLDCTQLTFAESTGISALLLVNNAATKLGCSRRVAALPPGLLQLVYLTGLDKVLALEPDAPPSTVQSAADAPPAALPQAPQPPEADAQTQTANLAALIRGHKAGQARRRAALEAAAADLTPALQAELTCVVPEGGYRDGLDGPVRVQISAHSTRRGFITDAFTREGADPEKIGRRQAGFAPGSRTLYRYRDVDLGWDDDPTGGLLGPALGSPPRPRTRA